VRPRDTCGLSSHSPVSVPAVLAEGDRLPEARVWLGPREQVTLAEIVQDGPALLFFYLFDWSAT
jgi:hypothetical protein